MSEEEISEIPGAKRKAIEREKYRIMGRIANMPEVGAEKRAQDYERLLDKIDPTRENQKGKEDTQELPVLIEIDKPQISLEKAEVRWGDISLSNLLVEKRKKDSNANQLSIGRTWMGSEKEDPAKEPDIGIFNDLREFDRSKVSREHAVLIFEGNKVFVKDVGSRNETFTLNEDMNTLAPRSTATELKIGNAVWLGHPEEEGTFGFRVLNQGSDKGDEDDEDDEEEPKWVLHPLKVRK